jgi:Domain of unknown function (DUF3806)
VTDSPADVTISSVGADEQRILEEWLADAAQHGIDIDDVASISGAFDAYVEKMVLAKASERGDPTTFCTMIGFAMGENLVRRTVLEWRVVTDGQGTDLALATPTEDAILFPVDPVAAAWEVAETGWMPQWVENLLAGLPTQ